MTQRIILFNGPPRSGKDTAARACMEAEDLSSHYRVFDRMSMPCKKAFAATLNKSIDRWGNVEFFEDSKDDYETIYGVTYRQWQIDFSERFLKPIYGEDVFGRLFHERAIRNQHPDAVIFVPDCGFNIEYESLSKNFGTENVLVIKIYRPGTDYKNDSRSYLKVGSFGDKRDTEQVIHINNAGTLNEFKRKIVSRVGMWLGKGV